MEIFFTGNYSARGRHQRWPPRYGGVAKMMADGVGVECEHRPLLSCAGAKEILRRMPLRQIADHCLTRVDRVRQRGQIQQGWRRGFARVAHGACVFLEWPRCGNRLAVHRGGAEYLPCRAETARRSSSRCFSHYDQRVTASACGVSWDATGDTLRTITQACIDHPEWAEAGTSK